MTILRVDFSELYQRHLCRHGQYGINVIHLASLLGTYLAILLILHWLFGLWVLPALALPYLALLAVNLPVRVLAVVSAGVAALFALHWLLNVVWLVPALEALPVPWLPLWVGLTLVVIFYKIQIWSHRWYPLARDMTEFNRKYPKGSRLFVVLSLYELALLLNYLVFDRASWATTLTTNPTPVSVTAGFIPVAERPPAAV